MIIVTSIQPTNEGRGFKTFNTIRKDFSIFLHMIRIIFFYVFVVCKYLKMLISEKYKMPENDENDLKVSFKIRIKNVAVFEGLTYMTTLKLSITQFTNKEF